MKRISYCYKLYDILRIDHFRGFESYYSIPYGDPTAEFGHWEKGPDYDFFRTLKQELGAKEVIAEDLGYLTPAVLKMVKKTGYPGMKVLQFAFDPREESDYLPHNYTQNSVVYTGTHGKGGAFQRFRHCCNTGSGLARPGCRGTYQYPLHSGGELEVAPEKRPVQPGACGAHPHDDQAVWQISSII